MPSQYRAVWSAAGGGTGYSVFHGGNATDETLAQTFADTIRAFFLAVANLMPEDTTITFDSEVINMNNDGVLTDVKSVTTPTAVAGSGTSGFARAQGARIDWLTGAIVSGRRLKGRTYLVPLMSFCFDTNGLLTSIVQTQLNEKSQDLIDDLDAGGIPLFVWSRTHAFAAEVNDKSVPSKGAILRSRRD